VHWTRTSARRKAARGLCLALLALLLAAPAAQAVDPNQVIGGSNGRWFSGSLIQQTGLNCSTAILGSAYTEVMVSGVSSYGGLPGVPRVNDGYWTSLLVAIPGNPCGTGSSSVSTDVSLPPGTTVDTSRPIRCFGQPRTSNTFQEITNESWSFLGQSGRYCPTQATNSAQNPGALHLGFRPLANGQLFQIFVPVRSSQQLIGAAANPTQSFQWFTNASGVYTNPGVSSVWANVFPASTPGGNTPEVFFAREPSVVPFWKADAPTTPFDTRNRAELFVNVYTAGLSGQLCYEVRRVSDNSLRATCSIDPGYNGTVAAGLDLVQILPAPNVTGPNGGYAPFSFDGPDRPDPEWDQEMRITWTFDPDDPSKPTVSRTATFRTLPGPDSDGDGVADINDACPSTKGTQANGCLPTVQGDDDGDGAFGANDQCPSEHGQGALNGCPVAAGGPGPEPGTGPSSTPGGATTIVGGGGALSGALGVKRNAAVKRADLLKKGATVPVTCSKDADAALSLVVSKKVAKTLKIKSKSAELAIASAKGACKANGGAQLKLKVASKYKRNLTRARKAFAATLTLKLTEAGSTIAPSKVAVKVR
jgi:hypothetical protein